MNPIKTVLVPLDGSELSERALPLGTELAQRHDARLVLVRAAEAHVLPGVDPSERQLVEVNDAEAYLGALAGSLSLESDRVETAVPYGPADRSILLEIKLRGADIVVMTTHGLHGLTSLVAGGVTSSVLREAPVPVLVLPARAPTHRRLAIDLNVVVALDGSELSEAVVADVISLIGDKPALVTLVRAVSGGAAEEHESREQLARVETEFGDDRIRVHQQIRPGEPATVLIDAARELGADVIALATHGRSGLGRLVLGSVAERVIRGSSIPILVRRPDPALIPETRPSVELPIFQIG